MLLRLIGLALLVWLGLRGYQNLKPSSRKKALQARTQAAGEAGEAAVSDCLQGLLQAISEGPFCLRNSLILNHAPGAAFPTAEVDHLAVTPFGILVLETKHRSGKILPADDGMLLRVSRDGTSKARKNPAVQNSSKVAFLKSILPLHAKAIRGVGIFSHPDVRLDMRITSDLLCLDELGYWLRARRDGYRATRMPPIDTAEVLRTILEHADTSADAVRNQKHRVAAMA
ncbi:nuclease-related domain-containing protein [Paraburkholderia aromaticivorans]|uniref:nuclease-related domain-containing protein n=1 Tax=Paraburkholderia aromaticivorans TaxID=2026199 RepID=UPI001455E6CF|nr:nuclease-related domain-containing protein [Paraburkholderia aromaticivorans]